MMCQCPQIMHELYLFMVQRLGSLNDLLLVNKKPPFSSEFIEVLNQREDDYVKDFSLKERS